MKKETYRRMTEYFKKRPEKVKQIQWCNKIMTSVVFVSYPVFLLSLLLQKDEFLLPAVAVPASSFVIVSLFRKIINEPRPYEKFGLPPVLEKDTKGQSFPSRHVFSVFVIATTVFVRHPAAGLLLGVLGVLLGALRVVGGVHTPLDVMAGALAGIVCGVFGYYWMPYC